MRVHEKKKKKIYIYIFMSQGARQIKVKCSFETPLPSNIIENG